MFCGDHDWFSSSNSRLLAQLGKPVDGDLGTSFEYILFGMLVSVWACHTEFGECGLAAPSQLGAAPSKLVSPKPILEPAPRFGSSLEPAVLLFLEGATELFLEVALEVGVEMLACLRPTNVVVGVMCRPFESKDDIPALANEECCVPPGGVADPGLAMDEGLSGILILNPRQSSGESVV